MYYLCILKRGLLVLLTWVLLLGALYGSGGLASPYLNKIWAYVPAPGQFVDASALVKEGENPDFLDAEKVCDFLTQKMKSQAGDYIISLGAFGGYIVFGFDHTIQRNPGGYDFKIYGNAFYDPAYTPESGNRVGGNAEPGIVMVSQDVNKDGLPNDLWYELAGSEALDSQTIKDYRMVYYRPQKAEESIFWRDNQGDTGYIYRNEFHSQRSYYPMWLGLDSLVFEGCRLPDNAENIGKDGLERWMLYAYAYGYADNHPNASEGALFRLDWAVDSLGKSVFLKEIDFIKVYTGVRQNIGWTGEISTEFAGAEDMSLSTGFQKNRKSVLGGKVFPNPCSAYLQVRGQGIKVLRLYSARGVLLKEVQGLEARDSFGLDMSPWSPGYYLLEGQTASGSWYQKVIKQ